VDSYVGGWVVLEKCAGPGAHGAGAELFGEVAVPGWFLGRHQLCGGVAGPTSGERVVALHLANPFGSLARQDAIPRLLRENNIAVAMLGDGARYQDWTGERRHSLLQPPARVGQRVGDHFGTTRCARC
jgi:hypothetical protein